MTKSYDPPIKITIPTPGQFPMGYGPNSTGGKGGNMRARCTNKEYELLGVEAAAIGITLANFVRWSSFYVAKALQKHRLENSTTEETEIDNE